MAYQREHQDEPCFVISIAARMVGLHAQTLRYYERVGIIRPSRTLGGSGSIPKPTLNGCAASRPLPRIWGSTWPARRWP